MISTAEFNTELEQILKKIESLLHAKATEYAPDPNRRFSNFEDAARILNTSPLVAWQGFFTKHLVSLFEIIQHPHYYHIDIVEEKVHDLIAYLIIFEIMFKKLKTKKQETQK